jgi:hypothetical protein
MPTNELVARPEGDMAILAQSPPQETMDTDPSLFARLGDFARDHTRALRIGGAALLSTAVCAVAPAVALANKRPLNKSAAPEVTPLSMESYVKLYVADTINYGQSFANSGAMGLVEHLNTTPHSIVAIAPCNELSGNKGNLVRYVSDNLHGESEITCKNGDEPVQRPFEPHSQYCPDPTTQPNCKDMNIGKAQQYVSSKVEAYIESLNPKYGHASFGNVSRMAIDNYNSQRETDLHLYYKRSVARSSSSTRAVEEVSLFTDKGKESFSVEFYK